MDNKDKQERLRRLKALADRGVNVSERETAAAMLLKLCAKYGISVDDVEGDDEKDLVWFVHKQGDLFRKLMVQVIAKVCGHQSIYKRGRERILGTYCTKAQAIEIEMDYDFYLKGLKEEFSRMLKVYIQKNHITPARTETNDNEDASEETEWTDEDMALYGALKVRTRRKQLE
jgi:hypothetical protein